MYGLIRIQIRSKSIFESFLKKHMGKSLPTKIIDESFSNLTITSDPIKNSVLTFAERADVIGISWKNWLQFRWNFLSTGFKSEQNGETAKWVN